MSSTDKSENPFSELSLVPIDEPGLATSTPAMKLHPNSRTKADRRVIADRRQVLRFEPDRRSGKTRRPQSSWDSVRRFD